MDTYMDTRFLTGIPTPCPLPLPFPNALIGNPAMVPLPIPPEGMYSFNRGWRICDEFLGFKGCLNREGEGRFVEVLRGSSAVGFSASKGIYSF
jgi:hypothetical protein